MQSLPANIDLQVYKLVDFAYVQTSGIHTAREFPGHVEGWAQVHVPLHLFTAISIISFNLGTNNNCESAYLELFHNDTYKQNRMWKACTTNTSTATDLPGMQEGDVPKQTLGGLWECSTAAMWQTHVWCNQITECVGAEDEADCTHLHPYSRLKYVSNESK
ncbi:hypothetical protein BaRGS_00029667 [Batillaria attramentaria]|uniref:Uncharacterized protein n=1 Tax=Batillaria attramentaria TaxID=370345 RepID=A0ABD0JVH3_9CAEN